MESCARGAGRGCVEARMSMCEYSYTALSKTVVYIHNTCTVYNYTAMCTRGDMHVDRIVLQAHTYTAITRIALSSLIVQVANRVQLYIVLYRSSEHMPHSVMQ